MQITIGTSRKTYTTRLFVYSLALIITQKFAPLRFPLCRALGVRAIKPAILHLAFPIVFAFILAAIGARNQSGKEIMAIISGSVLFYGAPHICWAVVHLAARPRQPVVHAGYIGATSALLLIASLWLLPQDPSGLPVQWMAYWPLAAILIVVFALVTYFVARPPRSS